MGEWKRIDKFNIIYLMKDKVFQIAIDGPMGSGKSTVTKLVAERLEFLYVDTGAMYRVGALLGVRAKVDFDDEEVMLGLVEKSKIELRNPVESEMDGRLVTVRLDGEDVSWAIRAEKISRMVPRVAVMPRVRKMMVKRQQEIASAQNVVMEGRDITYRVLPEADLKIYLTASEKERAKRRRAQLQSRGEDVNFEEVLTDLKKRDEMDMNREADPLQIVDGAWVLDTSNMTINQVVEMISDKVIKLRIEQI